MSENSQKNAIPESGFAPSTTSDACFVFVRYWPGFSEQFPYGKFDSISDGEIDNRLWAALNSELEQRNVPHTVIERVRNDCEGFPGAEFMKLAEIVGWSEGLYHVEGLVQPRLCSRKACIGVTATREEADALINELRNDAVILSGSYDSWDTSKDDWSTNWFQNPRFTCVTASELSRSELAQARLSINQLRLGEARDSLERHVSKYVQLVDSFHELWQQIDAVDADRAESGVRNGQGESSMSDAPLTRESNETSSDFIESLLDGPDKRELTPTDLALLVAFIEQPKDLAIIQAERCPQSTDESETRSALSKLILIRDFNRQLHAAGGVTAQLVKQKSTTEGSVANQATYRPGETPDGTDGERESNSVSTLHESSIGLGSNKPDGAENKLIWLAQAMLQVREHPEWSDAEIARKVGKHPSTLSRSAEYQAAASLVRGSKLDRDHGFIVVDSDSGLRDVEAVAKTASQPDDKSDRGQRIPASKYFREYCAECQDPIKVLSEKVGTNPVCDDCGS